LQEEEEEMNRLMREWEEDERRRKEELRLAKEEEDAKRLAREAEEARRRHAEELERRRREAEEERRLLEEEQRRWEEQQREEEEERRKAEERRRREAERAAFMDAAFDDFEKACDAAGAEETLDAVFAELANGGTPPGSPPPEVAQRMSVMTSAETSGGFEALMAALPSERPMATAGSVQTEAAPVEAEEKDAGADWMARAMAALGDDDDDSSSGEEEGGGTVADDLELLKFTEAIASRIEELHVR